MGGMVTSVDGQVRRADGSVIDGLYAAGACASNIAENGKNYASGTQLGEGSFFGRRADVTPRQPRRTDSLPPRSAAASLASATATSSSALLTASTLATAPARTTLCASDTARAIAVAGNSGRGRPHRQERAAGRVPECEQVRLPERVRSPQGCGCRLDLRRTGRVIVGIGRAPAAPPRTARSSTPAPRIGDWASGAASSAERRA